LKKFLFLVTSCAHLDWKQSWEMWFWQKTNQEPFCARRDDNEAYAFQCFKPTPCEGKRSHDPVIQVCCQGDGFLIHHRKLIGIQISTTIMCIFLFFLCKHLNLLNKGILSKYLLYNFQFMHPWRNTRVSTNILYKRQTGRQKIG
jgi:hypothetical protein